MPTVNPAIPLLSLDPGWHEAVVPWQHRIMQLMVSLGYSGVAINGAAEYADRVGSFAGCPYVEDEDFDRLEALLPESPSWQIRFWDSFWITPTR